MFDFIFGVIAFVVGIWMLIAICTFVADIVRYPFRKRREKAEKRRDELDFQEQERQRQLAIKEQAEEEAAAKKEAALKQRRINKKLKSNGYLSEGKWEVGDLCDFLREYGIKRDMFPLTELEPATFGDKLSNVSEESRLVNNLEKSQQIFSKLDRVKAILAEEAEKTLLEDASKGADYPYIITYHRYSPATETLQAILDLGLLGQSNNYSPRDAASIFLDQFLKDKDVKGSIAWFDNEGIAVQIDSYGQRIIFRKKSAINSSTEETY